MYRKKTTIVIVMCVMVLLMGIGYALLSTELNINGSTSITSTWKVEFSAIRTTSQKGGATNKVNPTYTATTASFQVDLVQPGDEITYEIDVTNYGDIKAEIKGASYDITGSEAIYVEFEGIRKGTTIGSCEGLTTCPKVTATIRVGYDESVTKDPSSKTKNIKITLNVGQYIASSPTPDGELIPELKTSLVRKILNDNTAQSDEGIDFTKNSSDTNGKGLYYTSTNTEGNKKTYYFRGAVTNNYVSFAGQTWRIVRINEDGSVRIIKSDSIGTSAFNTIASDNSYVGYMYGYPITTALWGDANGDGQVDSDDAVAVKDGTYLKSQEVLADVNLDGVVNEEDATRILYHYMQPNSYSIPIGTDEAKYNVSHYNVYDSAVKAKIDAWYKNNLVNYTGYLTDAGFCNDRTKSSTASSWASNDTALGHSTNLTDYGSYNRLSNLKKPQFSCPNERRDLFTVKGSHKGNKALTYPVGLLTEDEVIYAGAGIPYSENATYYLSSTSISWTMTPYNFSTHANVSNFGQYTNKSVSVDTSYINIRPVINLRASVEVLSGNGTSSSPYVLKTS